MTSACLKRPAFSMELRCGAFMLTQPYPLWKRSPLSPRIFTVLLFEEQVFSSRSPLLTLESTNTVLWEEDEDAVKSTELWGQDEKLC